MTSSMAKKARSASTVGSNRTCPDGRSRKNKHSNGILSTESRRCLMKPICNEGE